MIREHHCSRIDAWLRSHGHFASTAINDSRLLVCTKTRSATCAPVRPPASPCQRTAVLPYVQRPPSFASCKRLLTKYFMEPLTLFTGSRKAKVRTGTVLSPRGPNVRILTQRLRGRNPEVSRQVRGRALLASGRGQPPRGGNRCSLFLLVLTLSR